MEVFVIGLGVIMLAGIAWFVWCASQDEEVGPHQ